MRLLILLGLMSFDLFRAGAAVAAPAMDPRGLWFVEDKSAQIEIESCNGVLWGVVAWERSPGRDTQNPNPALRGRPTLGMPILLGMRPAASSGAGGSEGIWRGHIYNARDGSTYEANIKPVDADTLHLEGCVLGGLFCGGQNWARVKTPTNPPKSAAEVCAVAGRVRGY
ncbi:MAG TPA: DUF2147 domain-containing protein [Xanthobacteraceae bacterium]|jgi:uncharacterized protein (DUF2147 family)|nr:DUF2147 domain-containing protein [Xanthobacteraceae bacterium]